MELHYRVQTFFVSSLSSFFGVIHNFVIILTETFTLLSFSTSVFDVFRAEKTEFSPLCFDTHRLHNTHSVRVTRYSSKKRPRSKSFHSSVEFSRVTRSLHVLLIFKQPWLFFGKKKIHFGKVYSVANLKPVCNCNCDPLKRLHLNAQILFFSSCHSVKFPAVLMESVPFCVFSGWLRCLQICPTYCCHRCCIQWQVRR